MKNGADETLYIRKKLRSALDASDIPQVVRLGDDLKQVLIKFDRWGAIGDVPAIRIARVIAVEHNKEIKQLASEFLSDRQDEVRNVVLYSEGQIGGYEPLMLATVLDKTVSELCAYGPFATDKCRDAFMWGNELKNPRTHLQPLIGKGLSYNARLTICALKAVTRFVPTTIQEIAYAVVIEEPEAQRVITELQQHGLARKSSTADYLSLLTVEQLKPLIEGIPVATHIKKENMIKKIVSAKSQDEILAHVRSMDQANLEKTWTVGLNKLAESKFHRQWSRLIAHFLMFSNSRDGNWMEYKDQEAAGYLRKGWRLQVCGGAPNECRLCADMDKKIISTNESAPPFHLGCRCSTNLVFPTEY